MCVELQAELSLAHTVNQDLSVLAASCEQGVVTIGAAQVITPLDCEDSAAFRVQSQLWLLFLWRPNANEAVVRAAGEKSFIGVPLDLLNNLIMTIPPGQRVSGLVNAP